MTSSRLAAASLAMALCASAGGPRLFEAVEPHMGTLVRIQFYAAGEAQAASAFRAAFARIAELDAALSDYRPESELNRVGGTAVGRPVAISDDLFRVLAASQKLASETGGAFDVTLGPVVRLWRQARKEHRVPDAAALQEAASRCGYGKLRLNAASRTVMLDEAGMQLDVGGIAKGDAADQALAVLRGMGIRSALVAASGDLAIGDPPPGRVGWRIGIDASDRVLELANAAVSTSGDEQQHLDSGGARYSHIVDPATGMGLTSPITVTIVARRGIDADGLATAVSVLGADRGIEFIETQPDAAALIVTEGGVRQSSRWRFAATGSPGPSVPRRSRPAGVP